ncbi:MAG: hypothetical protein U0183_19610 [Polyangiaceae bacterium]
MVFPKWGAWLLVAFAAVAFAPVTACSSRIETCDEIGSDWQACPNVSPLVCVQKADLSYCNKVQPGSVDAGTGTTKDAGKCGTVAVDCSGQCVLTQSDPKNCGRCGNACDATEFCRDGVCQ